jgi:hypothetical protein
MPLASPPIPLREILDIADELPDLLDGPVDYYAFIKLDRCDISSRH